MQLQLKAKEQTLQICNPTLRIGDGSLSLEHLQYIRVQQDNDTEGSIVDYNLGRLICQINNTSPKLTALILEAIAFRNIVKFTGLEEISKEELDMWALETIRAYKYQLYESFVTKQHLDLDLTLSKALLLPDNLGLAYYYLQDMFCRARSELNVNSYRFLIDLNLYKKVINKELEELAGRVIQKVNLPCKNKYMTESDNNVLRALKSIPKDFKTEVCYTVNKFFISYLEES